MGGKAPTWVEVVKKKKRDRARKEPPGKPAPTKAPKRRSRGEAIVIKTEEPKYAEVLKGMRANAQLQDLGDDVKSIRRTRTGEMLLILKKSAKTSSSAHMAAARQVLGEGVTMRALAPEVTIQCKELDEFTTEDELVAAIKKECNVMVAKILMRKGPQGTKVATFKLPMTEASKVLQAGKVKVNWSVCPLSVVNRPEACFKCLQFGHKSWACKGPDRSKLCRRCGTEGHKAAGCKEKPKCLICPGSSNGHVTGGFACPLYKRELVNKGQWK